MDSVITTRPVLPPLQTDAHFHGDISSSVGLHGSSSTTELASKKRNSFLSKTFRSFSSSSSLDTSAANAESRSGSRTPPRRVLQKTPTVTSSSIFHRISRRPSKDSTTSSQCSDVSGKLASLKVLKHGPLKTDSKLWKSRSDYLVITENCLVKFGSVDAARNTFNDIGGPTNRLSRSSTISSLNHETGSADSRLEIPLNRIINIFNEEGSSPHFGLDVWWAETSPVVAWSNVKLFFSMPQERDDWLAEIRRAIREYMGRPGVPGGMISPNVEQRIHSIVAAEEPSCSGVPLDIFPVVQRNTSHRVKPDASDAAKKIRDASSYYLLLGLSKCYLVRVFRTTVHKPAQELDVSVVVFGLTSLIRLKATMIPHEERFVLSFRLPREHEKRLDLASRWYREIVMTFMKADRAVKPAWPQHLQNDIFDIRGLTAQLNLPSGQDFGGLKRTLEAYCATYGCDIPQWTVNWKCERKEHNPEFRLIPSTSPDGYTAFQLLAVFKALRFNDYFKSLSFSGVDFEPLCGWVDSPHHDDSIADVSRNGLMIDGVHREILKTAPILFQEIHAITFTSGSIRKIDLTDVLASRRTPAGNRFKSSRGAPIMEVEIARPILLLLRTQNIPLDSLVLAGHTLTTAEVNELASALSIPNLFRHLNISRCGLDERSLEEMWDVLPSQAATLEVLDTSHNFGNIDHAVIRNSLAHFTRLRKLSIAGNCLSQFTDFLFYDEVILGWQLEELDLSDVKLSDETVNVLATYLSMPESNCLQRLYLSNCGMTGSAVAVLFRSMGQNREMVCSVSGNYLENGGDDLVTAVAYNYGPKALFMDMIEYREESNFNKMIKALAVNTTINLLSLVGTATPDQVSEEACGVVSDLFATNTTLRYLDFSGFSAKLDEGQLGLGFSRSLAGLAQNTTLHHLRIRNQKLNMNIGDLSSAISKNKTLLTLDVQDNGFNLSNLTHMARSLEKNSKIQEFLPFSGAELSRTIQSSMQQASVNAGEPEHHQRRRLSSKAVAKAQSIAEDASRALLQELRGAWTTKMDQIERILKRNRDAPTLLELDWALPNHGSHFLAAELPVVFGGLAVRNRDRKRPSDVDGASHAGSKSSESLPLLSIPSVDLLPRISLDEAPHHVSKDEIMGSPTSDAEAAAAANFPTPPEWAISDSPTEEGRVKDEAFASVHTRQASFLS